MAMQITNQQVYALSSRVEALAIDDIAEQQEVDCVYVSGQHQQFALLKLFVKDSSYILHLKSVDTHALVRKSRKQALHIVCRCQGLVC